MRFREKNTRFAAHVGMAPQAFSQPIITVELGQAAASSEGNTASFLLAVNLLARTFETVHAVFPDEAVTRRHPWGLHTVRAVIDEVNATVDGDLHIGPPAHSDVVLSIGARPSTRADRRVVIAGSHWRAALDCDLPGAGEGIFGCLYAACLGAAQVLLHVLHSIDKSYEPMAGFSFSLLDLLMSGEEGPVAASIEIPEAHLVGVGAVGSAAVYALAHLDEMGGFLHLIDNDRVDASNLHRYVLMRRQDIGRWKVDVAAEALRGTAIQTEAYPGAYSDYSDTRGTNVDLLLSPVDSKEGRRELARTLPRRVINAATGGSTVTISTHGFNDGKACLYCLYPPDAKRKSQEEVMAEDTGISPEIIRELVRTNTAVDEPLVERIERHRGAAPLTWAEYVGMPILSFYARAVCGDAQLRLPGVDVVAPLSFISASAGIILAAELVKAGHSELAARALDNYLRIDTLHKPNPAFRKVQRQDTLGICICWDTAYIDTYADKYGSA